MAIKSCDLRHLPVTGTPPGPGAYVFECTPWSLSAKNYMNTGKLCARPEPQLIIIGVKLNKQTVVLIFM